MNKLLAISAAPLLVAACMAPSQREAGVSSEESIPARDGNVAIKEEFDAARRAGTTAAWDLFIARHPQHPLVEKARAERAKLAR
jgi:hypothetical protein